MFSKAFNYIRDWYITPKGVTVEEYRDLAKDSLHEVLNSWSYESYVGRVREAKSKQAKQARDQHEARENIRRAKEKLDDEIREAREANRNSRKNEDEFKFNKSRAYNDYMNSWTSGSNSVPREFFTSCKVLNINPDQRLNKKILRDSYLNALKSAHPDKGGSHEATLKVNNAYNFLGKYT